MVESNVLQEGESLDNCFKLFTEPLDGYDYCCSENKKSEFNQSYGNKRSYNFRSPQMLFPDQNAHLELSQISDAPVRVVTPKKAWALTFTTVVSSLLGSEKGRRVDGSRIFHFYGICGAYDLSTSQISIFLGLAM